MVTLQRSAAFAPEDQTLDNPEWVKFLLYDNEDGIRKITTYSNPRASR